MSVVNVTFAALVLFLFILTSHHLIKREVIIAKTLRNLTRQSPAKQDSPTLTKNRHVHLRKAPFPEPTCGKRNVRITGPHHVDNIGNIRKNRIYYDVVFPPKCIPDWRGLDISPLILQEDGLLTKGVWDYHALNQIVKHWQSTLPLGIRAFYPINSPYIFFHGHARDPYDEMEQNGYLVDSNDGRYLWTVALTDYSVDIAETFGSSAQQKWKYLVVLKLKNKMQMIIKSSVKSDYQVPSEWDNEHRIIARVLTGNQHPDTFVFTRIAQMEEYEPLEIVRVYRYHFANGDGSADAPDLNRLLHNQDI